MTAEEATPDPRGRLTVLAGPTAVGNCIQRFLWDAKDVYLGMSPFLFANNLTGAVLLYHGLHDQNVGTDPDNSIRLYHALNGLGTTVVVATM